MFCGSWQGGCGCGWRPSYRMPVRSSAFFPGEAAADQGLAWRDEKHWLWATREAWGSDACADVGSLSQLAETLQIPLRLCIDAGDEAGRFDVLAWKFTVGLRASR